MIIVLFIICSYAREKVSIIKEASFLDDFCVDKETGTVTINCSVTIKNECNDMNLYALLGYFPKDVNILIEEPVILAVDNNTGSNLL